jgi:MFS family permease
VAARRRGLGFFVVSVDASIVNVALPTIARDLQAGISGLQWVVDGCAAVVLAPPGCSC